MYMRVCYANNMAITPREISPLGRCGLGRCGLRCCLSVRWEALVTRDLDLLLVARAPRLTMASGCGGRPIQFSIIYYQHSILNYLLSAIQSLRRFVCRVHVRACSGCARRGGGRGGTGGGSLCVGVALTHVPWSGGAPVERLCRRPRNSRRSRPQLPYCLPFWPRSITRATANAGLLLLLLLLQRRRRSAVAVAADPECARRLSIQDGHQRRRRR